MGKILGETLVSFILVFGVLALGLLMRIPFNLGVILRLVPLSLVVALFGGSFGVMVMSLFSDQKSASQIFPFLLFPQFFLAGVFNPIQKLPLLVLIASRIAPMTYAVDLLRSVYYLGDPAYKYVVIFGPAIDFVVIAVLGTVFLSVGTWMFIKKEKDR
jgi:ABC-2 type transport system permease protein